ncbi:MAG: hypothetical protein HY434_02510 [Candidatus Liptonbacteria bacterium]|nr:hypothetical protein [Candidatus Liptonbacteria bacterium]
MTKIRKIFFALTGRERVVFLSAAALAIVSGIILTGLGFAQNTRVVPASGGEYTEGFLEQPIYINPVIASLVVDKSIVKLVFENIRGIAEKIETSPDGRIWNIRIKENLEWHDGERLTTDDVVFTIQKIQDPESSSPLEKIWRGVSVKRVSGLELQLSLVNADPFFRETLNTLYVLPKHLFSEIPPANWRLSDYNLKPVGAGPYKFSSYEKKPDGFIGLYRLEQWNDYPGEKPLIGNFTLKFFSDLQGVIGDFNSGQIDGIAGLEPDAVSQIKRPHETFSFYLPSYYAVFLNQSKSIPLKDLSVRRALSASVGRAGLVESALGGRGKPALGPIPAETPYFDESISSSTESIESLGDALDRAGWKMNDQGVREKTIKNTKLPLELNLTVPQITFLTKTAEVLAKTWQPLGFKININTPGLEEIAKNTITNRDYEMLVFGNVLNKNLDLFSFWHSSGRFNPGLNLALYNNKKADALIESIRLDSNEESRAKKLRDLQTIITSDYPAVFLYSPEYTYITTKNLQGVSAGLVADPSDRFVDAKQWYVKTARVLK